MQPSPGDLRLYDVIRVESERYTYPGYPIVKTIPRPEIMKYPQIVTLIVLTLFVSSVFSFSRYALTSFKSVISTSEEQPLASGLSLNALVTSTDEKDTILTDDPKACTVATFHEEEVENDKLPVGKNCIKWTGLNIFCTDLIDRNNAFFSEEINPTDLYGRLTESLPSISFLVIPE